MLASILNKTIYRNKYHTHPEAVVISCYFNSEKSPYRLSAFKTWYESIKHLNHRIIECVIGDGTSELDFIDDKDISVIRTPNLFWHKEAILNKIVSELPDKFNYVFWVDADIIFTNLDWMVDGVKELQVNNLIQPFEYCVHLERGQIKPTFNMNVVSVSKTPNRLNNNVWRSFAANYSDNINWRSENYNEHGHVGFAWGAKRKIIETVKLYDRALIGGADHIIAHAAVGQIPCSCITKAFSENIEEINNWSERFNYLVNGKVGYVKGNVFHIWHGDLKKREYLKRIQDFTPINKNIVNRDSNGLHITEDGTDEKYIKDYFKNREPIQNNYAYSGSTTLNKEVIYRNLKPKPVLVRRNTEPLKKMTKTIFNNIGEGYQRVNNNLLIVEDLIIDNIVNDDNLTITESLNFDSPEDLTNTEPLNFDGFDGFDGGSSGGAGASDTWIDDNDNNFS